MVRSIPRRRARRAIDPHAARRFDPLHSVLLKRMPAQVIDYPLEVVLSVWAAVSGIALLFGVSDPVSVQETLPPLLKVAWGFSLALSGATIGFGLMLRHFGTSVARGLGLLGTAALVYGISIFVWGGIERAIPAGPLLVSVALLCWLRSYWLAKREQILRYVAREGNDGVPLRAPGDRD